MWFSKNKEIDKHKKEYERFSSDVKNRISKNVEQQQKMHKEFEKKKKESDDFFKMFK